jgi:hypothetical protein
MTRAIQGRETSIPPAAASFAMPLGVSFPQLVLVPPLVLLASALALFTFQNVYRVLFTSA